MIDVVRLFPLKLLGFATLELNEKHASQALVCDVNVRSSCDDISSGESVRKQ